MKPLILALMFAAVGTALAASSGKLNFSYKDADVLAVIKDYSQASGQKFVVDPNVKARVTIFNPEPISVEEAYNQLSMALASSSLAISRQGDVLKVADARNIQRNLIDVSTELPPLKPEKMHTWIVNMKFVSADDVNKQMRILTSRDGELVPFTPRNQLIITDWVSNLHRIAAILAQVDKPADKSAAAPAKSAKSAKKE